MSSEFTIRPVRPDDYPHLLALHVAAVMAIDNAYYSYNMRKSTVFGMTLERFDRMLSNGELIDIGCNAANEPPLGYTSVFGSELMSLFVHPKEQGRGLGKALLICAEKRFVSMGIKKASLRASLSAASFYENHGWTLAHIGHQPTRGKVRIEVAWMEKVLG